jgi:hypothetical protein
MCQSAGGQIQQIQGQKYIESAMSLFAPFGDTTNCPHLRVEATSLVFKSAPVSLNKPGDVAQLMIPSLCTACHSIRVRTRRFVGCIRL